MLKLKRRPWLHRGRMRHISVRKRSIVNKLLMGDANRIEKQFYKWQLKTNENCTTPMDLKRINCVLKINSICFEAINIQQVFYCMHEKNPVSHQRRHIKLAGIFSLINEIKNNAYVWKK